MTDPYKYYTGRRRWLLRNGDRNENDVLTDLRGEYVLMWAPRGDAKVYLPHKYQKYQYTYPHQSAIKI